MTIIIPKSEYSIHAPLPKSDDWYFLWQPMDLFKNKYSNLHLLFLEQSGKGKEFLKIIDVDGWKLCESSEFPGHPAYEGFVMIDNYLLCKKAK